jgi:hypothetical protein
MNDHYGFVASLKAVWDNTDKTKMADYDLIKKVKLNLDIVDRTFDET